MQGDRQIVHGAAADGDEMDLLHRHGLDGDSSNRLPAITPYRNDSDTPERSSDHAVSQRRFPMPSPDSAALMKSAEDFDHRTMQLHLIDTGFFKLDGGAMFGVVPKTLGKTSCPGCEQPVHLGDALPAGGDGRPLILIDNGIGDKQDAKFFGHYDLHGDATLDGFPEEAWVFAG